MSNLKLLFRTIVHLRFKQIVYQLKYRIIKSKLRAQKAPLSVPLRLVPFINKWHCGKNNKTFTFLNLPSGFTSWNDSNQGMLWTYNLNYMDWLQQEDFPIEEGSKWIDKFIEELPNNHVGLDPYPTALRGINWIKFISEHRENIDDNCLQRWNNSLYSQYILLTKKLEYHLLGNHLLEDAYSLFIAAIYFKDSVFYNKSVKLLHQELEEQILPDGAHYEQSPMYHCILLDRLLDCCNFSFNNIQFDGQKRFNDFLWGKVVAMLGHLENIIYQDETIPLLNDSAYGIAPTVSQLRAYAKRLDLRWNPLPMKECGYRKLCSKRFEAIVDVGNIAATYQPGHSHADTFSYELRIDGKPFIVDTGISTYNKTDRRQYERSTAAHNTVSVNELNSSEVWEGFRVGKRAKVNVLYDAKNEVMAEHDSFKRCRHRRKFAINKEVFTINDEVVGNGIIECFSYIHFAPDIKILAISSTEIKTDMVNIAVSGATAIALLDDFVSVEYNSLKPSKVIKMVFDKDLTYRIFWPKI